jgi:hypothetical protein
LGLRVEGADSANVSKASSYNEGTTTDSDSEEGVKPSGPEGEEDLDVDPKDLPSPARGQQAPPVEKVNEGLDTASSTTGLREGAG